MPGFQSLPFQVVVVIVLKAVGLCGNFGFRQLQNHLQAETFTAVFLRSRQKTENGPTHGIGYGDARLGIAESLPISRLERSLTADASRAEHQP